MTDQIRTKSFGFDVKTEGDTPGFFKGVATTPKQDSYGDIIAVGAFQKSINDRGVAGPRAVKMLAQHQTQWLIGNWKSMSYVGDALTVEGQIDLDNQKGQEYYGYLKKDQLGSMSVGFRTLKRSYDEDTDILTILEGDLREISLVTFPANEDAVVTAVKSMLDGGDMKLSAIEKKIAHSFGLTRNQSSAVIREIRRVGLVAPAGGSPELPPVYTAEEIAERAAQELETKRVEKETTARDLLKEITQRLEQKRMLAEVDKIRALLRA